MNLQERLRMLRGDRTEGLLSPGERAKARVPRITDGGLQQLADDLDMPYHDEALQAEAAEQAWREGHIG